MSEKDSVFSKPLSLGYVEEAPPTDWSAFWTVVASRRSIRVFEDKSIPEAIVRDCLRAALLAPSSSNLQPAEFYWVRSPLKRSKLVEACLSQPAAATAAELIVCVARTSTWPRNRKLMLEHFDSQGGGPKAARAYYEKLVPLAYGMGPLGLFGLMKKVILSLRGLVKPTPREPTSKTDMRIWAIKSAALACENLMLAFRAHGYDTCPMEGMDSKWIKRLLRLPKDAEIVMVVSAGKRAAERVYGAQIRFDESLFVFEV